MSRVCRVVLAGFLSTLLFGCMAPPDLPERARVADVVNNVRCELYQAVEENWRQYPWLLDWAAAYTLTLIVDRDINSSADASFVVPVQNGTFSVGLKANLDQSAKGTWVVNFTIPRLRSYDLYGCSLVSGEHRRLLEGEVGLRRWINEMVRNIEAARIRAKDREHPVGAQGYTTGSTYTIRFVLTVGGSITPKWILAFANGSQASPSATFGAKKVATHELIVALAPPPYVPKGPKDLSLLRDENGNIIAKRVCAINTGDTSACVQKEQRSLAEDQAEEQQRRRAEKAAAAEASRLRELETERRLHEMIQNQIIRAAFRP